MNFADFIENLLLKLVVSDLRLSACDECLGNREISLIPTRRLTFHRPTEAFDGLSKPVLLHFAHHTVEIKVEKLQVEIGGDKRREIGIVVFLINVEKLDFPPGNNGKTIATERVFELRVERFELEGIQDVVSAKTMTSGKFLSPLQFSACSRS